MLSYSVASKSLMDSTGSAMNWSEGKYYLSGPSSALRGGCYVRRDAQQTRPRRFQEGGLSVHSVVPKSHGSCHAPAKISRAKAVHPARAITENKMNCYAQRNYDWKCSNLQSHSATHHRARPLEFLG